MCNIRLLNDPLGNMDTNLASKLNFNNLIKTRYMHSKKNNIPWTFGIMPFKDN